MCSVKRTAISGFSAAIVFLLWCSLGHSALDDDDAGNLGPEQYASTNTTEAGIERIELGLAKLSGSDAPVNLTGVNDTLSVSLPLPFTWQARDVVLHLRLVSSRTLIQTSQVVVYVNGNVAGQYSLESPGLPVDIAVPLPVEYLKKGFNQVDIRAIQHYTNVCEYPEAPQLWTQVNLVKSRFVIRARAETGRLKLSELDGLFDRATWQAHPEVTVFSPKDPSAGMLRALGLIAQGVGQRYDFVPVSILHRAMPQSNAKPDRQFAGGSRVAIYVGTFDALKASFPAADYPTDKGPVVAVRSLPDNRKAVLLMGSSEQEVVAAASAFAMLRVPWPDTDWVAINEVEIPAPENLEKRFSLPTAGSGAFPLRALGYRTVSQHGMDAASIQLPVWSNSWQGRVQVRLHMAYASGMAAESSLAVFSNGVMHGQVPLSNPDGGVYENYAVTIPAGAMKPGWNMLELKPLLYPGQTGGECQPWFDNNLSVTIYEDTTIQKFGGNELRRADLARISGQGLLFTEQSLGGDVGVYLAALNEDTLSAAMTLFAKLAQIYDRPLLNAAFSTTPGEGVSQQYWVGVWDQLPDAVRNSLDSSIPSGVDFQVPLMQSATVQVYEGGEWVASVLEFLGLRRTPPANTTEVEVNLSSDIFAQRSFALSTRSTNGEQLLVFTAANGPQLNRGIAAVVDYGLWAQLRGMLSYWSDDGKQVFSVTAEDAPFSAFGLRGGMGLWISQRPWLALFLLCSFLVLLVLLTRLVLRQYQRRHGQGS